MKASDLDKVSTFIARRKEAQHSLQQWQDVRTRQTQYEVHAEVGVFQFGVRASMILTPEMTDSILHTIKQQIKQLEVELFKLGVELDGPS